MLTRTNPTHRGVARLQRSLERLSRRRAPRLPAPQVLVQAPEESFEFGAVDRPFHAASAGKLLTATLVAQLVEQGRLSFDSPLGAVLPASDVAGLPAAPGVDVATDVTVEHLLTQTSGLPDYFEPRRGHDTAASVRGAVEHPGCRFTPADLLAEARTLPADGRPGERFGYSDTNWVLLGRIAEEAAGEAFAELLRTRIFEPAGMQRASTPYDATLIADDLTDLDVEPFWLGGHELSRAHAVSLDWAGGNVVAPPRDWVLYLQALRGGSLISHDTLAYLDRTRNRFRQGIRYGAGTMTLRFGELVPLLMRGLPEPVGHLGVWATHVFAYPEQDAYVVLNFHSDRAMQQSFMVHMQIARLLARR
ncbi:serine hydrolase domain-containing protein [Pseudactinotalea suaedae]|uniref:serine hydrolase domain-containing protein n=1 Tax=Pseudactinotalea suaedae TaxID=1524924 RepID=UPI0012E284D0|nr:serine hydrolase domain-containing protein [Pseudactinotalea suaedae]